MSSKITIKIYWTDKITEKAKNDFLFVQRNVFGAPSVARYEKRFDKNIYGSSLIVISYSSQNPIGARAMWRNDLSGNKAYQPGSTAVLKHYRRQGIFKKMTEAALEELDKTAMFYNFPNDLSLPGYLKMGWTLREKRSYRIVTPLTDRIINVDDIDNEYFDWMIGYNSDFNPKLRYTRFRGNIYLLFQRKKGIHVAMGRITSKNTIPCKKSMFPFFLEYSKTGYFGRGIVTVTKNVPINIKIPIHKVDTLF